jgi:hypothetical protein
MTKDEFEEFHRIHVEAWNELAETGDNEKPLILDRFRANCTACHITGLIKPIGAHKCRFCPIDIWRETYYKEGKINGPACCFQESGLYQQWWDETSDIGYNKEEAKKIAKKIAELNWSWLPKFEDVELTNELT